MRCSIVCSQVVLDRLRQPLFEAVAHRDHHLDDASVSSPPKRICSQNRAPSAPSPAQIPVDVAFPVHRDTHDNVERGVTDLTVADLHVRIAPGEDHRIDRIQRPA